MCRYRLRKDDPTDLALISCKSFNPKNHGSDNVREEIAFVTLNTSQTCTSLEHNDINFILYNLI